VTGGYDPGDPFEQDRRRGDIAPPSFGAHVSAVLIMLGVTVPIVVGLAGGGVQGWANTSVGFFTAAFVAAIYGAWSQRYRKRRHGG
jgi:hypothetical protein